jgi:hypothetical protein
MLPRLYTIILYTQSIYLFPLIITAGNIPSIPTESEKTHSSPIIPQNPHSFTLNLNVNSSNNNNLANENSSTQQQKSAQAQQQTNYFMPLQYYSHNFLHFIANQKYKILSLSVVGLYIYFFGRIWKDHTYIQRTDTCASWHYDIKLKDLKRIKAEQLALELIKDIQANHVDTRDPSNTTIPFSQFMQAMEYEIKRITSYLRLSSGIQRMRILFFFPTNTVTIQYAQEKLERAHFLKKIFATWMAEYKIKRDFTPYL